MAALRRETRTRARALQLLYAWELRGRPSIRAVADGFHTCGVDSAAGLERAELLAASVAEDVERLDGVIAEAAEHWRLERIGTIERAILRLAVWELLQETVPPRVAIDEAVRLAHWFAGAKAPAFVNGVLDALARRAGRL